MQTGVQVYLTTHFPWIDQIINVIPLDIVQFVLQVKETYDIEANRHEFTAFLAKVVLSEFIDTIAKKCFYTKHGGSRQTEIKQRVHGHKVLNLEAEIDDMIGVC